MDMVFCLYVCHMHAGPTRGQEMASDRRYLELQMVVSRNVGAGSRNPGPLEEQPKPLTTEPYLHPNSFFKNKNMIFFIIQSVCIWLAN